MRTDEKDDLHQVWRGDHGMVNIYDDRGIFDSHPGDVDSSEGGLEGFDRERREADASGVVVYRYCGSCGCPQRLLVSWSELICLRANVSPHLVRGAARWLPDVERDTLEVWLRKYDGTWSPNIQCSRCGLSVRSAFTRTEIVDRLRVARIEGWVRPNWDRHLSLVASVVARAARVHALVHGVRGRVGALVALLVPERERGSARSSPSDDWPARRPSHRRTH